jgi:hypothetical protein
VATKDKQPMGWYKGSGFMGWDQEQSFNPELDIDKNLLKEFIKNTSPVVKKPDEVSVSDGNIRDFQEIDKVMRELWKTQEDLREKEKKENEEEASRSKFYDDLREKEIDEELQKRSGTPEEKGDPIYETVYFSEAGAAVPDEVVAEELKTLDEEELKKLEEEDEIKEAIESEDIDYEQLRSEEIDAELAELFKDTEMIKEIEHLDDDQKKMLLEQRKELAKESKAGAAVPDATKETDAELVELLKDKISDVAPHLLTEEAEGIDHWTREQKDLGLAIRLSDFTYEMETSTKINKVNKKVLKLHHPTDGSGVTIGAGYDMKQRTEEEIIEDLTAAGISQETARIIAQAAGLSGGEAKKFVADNAKIKITKEQEVALFYKVYIEKINDLVNKLTNPADYETEPKYVKFLEKMLDKKAGSLGNIDDVRKATKEFLEKYGKDIQQIITKDPDKLQLLVDYEYNPNIYTFPKFFKALINNDFNEVKKEYHRYAKTKDGKKEPLGRNRGTLELIEKLEKKYGKTRIIS